MNELNERLDRVGDEVAGMREQIEAGLIGHARFAEADEQRCVECLRLWLDSSERWRTFLTIDNEAALYCPACAEAELGGDDA